MRSCPTKRRGVRGFQCFAGLLAILAGVFPPASARAQNLPGWNLVWSDEFDGPDIDMSKWSYEVNGQGGGNNELQYYTDRPTNSFIQDGKLVIQALKETYTGPDGTRNYTSARMRTKYKGEWTYGRFEARMKLPYGQGLWPAFWMLPTDSPYGGWAASGEIDIMEILGDQPNKLYGTIHYHGEWPNNWSSGGSYTLPSGDFSQDFHVFALEWEPGMMRWYVDGINYSTKTSWDTTSGAPFPAPFDVPFHILLNVAVGGNWPGSPDDTTVFPQQMVVDYVRVYSVSNGPPSIPLNLTATPGATEVVLNWTASAGATNYNVKQSTTDGGPYATIASPATTSYTNSGLVLGATYYYVVSAANAAGESSNSVQVSATTALPSPNLALNKPVTVSSVENASYAGSNAVDGNGGTRWSSAFSDPQWIYVDLQATYDISRVKLNWEPAYAKSYQIQVSSNAVNWATIYSTTTGGGGIEDLTGLSGTGRYVRMYGTVRATAYGYSLWELEVYGTANHAPELVGISDQSVLAGRTLLVTNSASDVDVPPQTLTYSLQGAPPGASVDANSGVFSWRPAIAQSPSTQAVAVVVADNGVPSLAATQSFTVTVVQPVSPVLDSASISNGQFGFWINGDTGPDYRIEASTNLIYWSPVMTNNSPPLPYFWVDTNTGSLPSVFYRVRLGP
jgi:beta-glucanase (GH16 family)